MNISVSGDVVAWYGAVVATASMVVWVYAVRRDRGKLKVSVRCNSRIAKSFEHYSKDKLYIVIEAVNTGRRPLHIGEPHFKLKGERGWIQVNGPWMPDNHLEEGKVAKILCIQEQFDDSTLSQISYVIVEDATGQAWKGKTPKAWQARPALERDCEHLPK